MEELTNNLREIGMRGGDSEVLSKAFGSTKFVCLGRQDAVAQAISRLRAEQTKIWHIRGAGDPETADRDIQYDREAIQHYLDEAQDHIQEWNNWFHQNEIVPLRLSYEDLDSNGESEIARVLDFVGVARPSSPLEAPNVRMADETSRVWAARFRAETRYVD